MPQQSKLKKTWSVGKTGFDKVWQSFDKLGGPVNKLSNKLGSEAFWPMTLDKESEKAARILRSFCKDGFYEEIDKEAWRTKGESKPTMKQTVLTQIPSEVIRKAKGLAIFTTMRTGLWMSGAGGSGILVGRIPETGEWSPPSGILLHTAGIGFLVGADIYDCVVVLNTYKALEAFATFRVTVGGELSAVAGPVGVGGIVDTEIHKRQAPVWTYLKSRGFYAGVQFDGTVILERMDENERFYNDHLSAREIVAGKVRHPPFEIRGLLETIKAAEGDKSADMSMLPTGETPGDAELDPSMFGVPPADDPDPYGVKALQQEGIQIREAGSQSAAKVDDFDFRPSTQSPIYNRWSSGGTADSKRTSRRTSILSTSTVDRGTQTDGSPSPSTTRDSSLREIDLIGEESAQPASASASTAAPAVAPAPASSKPKPKGPPPALPPRRIDTQKSQESNTGAPEPSPSFGKARMVNIARRPPPPLPPRNPSRASVMISPASSPTKHEPGEKDGEKVVDAVDKKTEENGESGNGEKNEVKTGDNKQVEKGEKDGGNDDEQRFSASSLESIEVYEVHDPSNQAQETVGGFRTFHLDQASADNARGHIEVSQGESLMQSHIHAGESKDLSAPGPEQEFQSAAPESDLERASPEPEYVTPEPEPAEPISAEPAPPKPGPDGLVSLEPRSEPEELASTHLHETLTSVATGNQGNSVHDGSDAENKHERGHGYDQAHDTTPWQEPISELDEEKEEPTDGKPVRNSVRESVLNGLRLNLDDDSDASITPAASFPAVHNAGVAGVGSGGLDLLQDGHGVEKSRAEEVPGPIREPEQMRQSLEETVEEFR